jgi:hypothetical protein
MPKKREASADEITALAKQFRALWRKGDALRPWMRKHRQMVIDLVHDGYSWETIAKAFSKAKIKYRDGHGQDWHAEGLRREFLRAAQPLKRDKNPSIVINAQKVGEAKDTLNIPPFNDEIPADSFTVASFPASNEPAVASVTPPAPMPRFKPVSFRPPEPRRMPSPEELEEIEQNRRLTFGHS